MLQNISEEIRRWAFRAGYLRAEQSWLKLTRSYELEQRMTLFFNKYRKLKGVAERAIRQVIDGPASATALLKPPEPGKPGNDSKRLESELIAIVDDDESARSGLMVLIESFGYKVAAFGSAEEYLASGISKSTACLILDVYMPGMSGPDLQAHLIADGRCPPTIFATGCFEEHVRKRVIEAGALGYLSKPCDERPWLSALERSFAGRRWFAPSRACRCASARAPSGKASRACVAAAKP